MPTPQGSDHGSRPADRPAGETVARTDLERGLDALVRDAAWASLAGSFYGGVILVGFAVALGASPFELGVLAAIPLLAQVMQLPAVALVERVRRRKPIAVGAVTASRVLILALAFVPFIASAPARLAALLAAQAAITALGSVCACALNSWLHQLLPPAGLGRFFSRRLCWATGIGCLATLAAGQVIDRWPYGGTPVPAYSAAFVLAALAGFASSRCLAAVPEPRMLPTTPHAGVFARLREPFADPNFRRFLAFMTAWNVASNFASPFITVFLLVQLGLPIGTVTILWVASQLANASTLYVWGRLSDRLSNKAVLSVAVPAWFACVLAFVLIGGPVPARFALPALVVLHIVMGIAAGGIGLANGNVGLKLAPQGRGTSYLAAIGLAGSVAGGAAPLVAGALGTWLESARLELELRWSGSTHSGEVAILTVSHWQFLFAIAAALGLYVLHRLSVIDEGHEHSERVVVQQFALEAIRTVNHLSSVAGLLGGLFTFGRLLDRRLRPRAAGPGATGPGPGPAS